MIQSGYGLGGIFSSLFRRIIPAGRAFLQSKTGQTLKDIGVQAASTTISDIIDGKNAGESARENLSDAKKKIGSLIKEKIEKRPHSRQRPYHRLTDSSDEESEPELKRKRKSKKKKKKNKANERFNLLE